MIDVISDSTQNPMAGSMSDMAMVRQLCKRLVVKNLVCIYVFDVPLNKVCAARDAALFVEASTSFSHIAYHRLTYAKDNKRPCRCEDCREHLAAMKEEIPPR
jgi:hypothetical protein